MNGPPSPPVRGCQGPGYLYSAVVLPCPAATTEMKFYSYARSQNVYRQTFLAQEWHTNLARPGEIGLPMDHEFRAHSIGLSADRITEPLFDFLRRSTIVFKYNTRTFWESRAIDLFDRWGMIEDLTMREHLTYGAKWTFEREDMARLTSSLHKPGLSSAATVAISELNIIRLGIEDKTMKRKMAASRIQGVAMAMEAMEPMRAPNPLTVWLTLAGDLNTEAEQTT